MKREEYRGMDYTRAEEMTRKLTRNGGLLGYSPEQARLLLRVLRTLSHGRAVSGTGLDAFADDLGWARAEAHAFLRPLTERDAAARIVGVLGLSLAEHPHGFTVDGHRMSTCCAEDTLFLPALLGQTATVESASPLSRDPIRLTVGPEGVQAVTPPETVVSIALVDPDQAGFGSVEAIWMTFCHLSRLETSSARCRGGSTVGSTVRGRSPNLRCRRCERPRPS